MVNSKRYKINSSENTDAARLEDKPTVSLCIPARNETHALEDCLGSAIASDYPKLEIIVLDDCSQDRTSQIIKGFAHDGVRFVKGETPSDNWLGKNNAYDILAREARGDYLVFMSVDTRLDSHTLSTLIAYLQINKLAMVSVLPRKINMWEASVLFAPLRYFWQVVLPLGVNIPTATSLWAVHSESLTEVGGIQTYKDKIMLENILAKQFFTKNQYHFLIANENLKVWYAKKWSSQAETAIRLWYPSLQKNLLYCLLVMTVHLLLFILPFIALIIGIANTSEILIVFSLITLLMSYGLFYFYLRYVQNGAQSIVSALLLPYISLQEIALIITSYYQYKRGRVSWKGRNICYPVLKRIR